VEKLGRVSLKKCSCCRVGAGAARSMSTSGALDRRSDERYVIVYSGKQTPKGVEAPLSKSEFGKTPNLGGRVVQVKEEKEEDSRKRS